MVTGLESLNLKRNGAEGVLQPAQSLQEFDTTKRLILRGQHEPYGLGPNMNFWCALGCATQPVSRSVNRANNTPNPASTEQWTCPSVWLEVAGASSVTSEFLS